MGSEARCVGRFGGRSSEGLAQLETDEVRFRGAASPRGRRAGEEEPLRVVLKRSEIRAVAVDGGTLSIDAAGDRLELDLGAAAARWAAKIEHPPSVVDKLGVKAGQRVSLVGPVAAFRSPEGRGAPAGAGDEGLIEEIRARVGASGACDAVTGRRAPGRDLDVLLFAVEDRAELARLPALLPHLTPDGALWIVRPKGVPAVTEGDVRAAARAAGLVDVKVARLSDTRTADKFVRPVAARDRRR